MKTRIKLHLIIYIAFAGLFMACENEIPYNPTTKSAAYHECPAHAGQTENLVYLHLVKETASPASMKHSFPLRKR